MSSFRVFVRGWTAPSVTEEEVRKRFEGLSWIKTITDVHVSQKRFAHVGVVLAEDCTPEMFLTKLQATYKNAKWKGGLLQFEKSLPGFVHILAEEKEERIRKEQDASTVSATVWDDASTLLRIRKRKGLAVITKKPKLVELPNDDDDDDDKDTNGYNRFVLPQSQLPGFCCSLGDAGPTTTINTMTTTSETETELSRVAKSLLASMPATMKKKTNKDAPHSLLGQVLCV